MNARAMRRARLPIALVSAVLAIAAQPLPAAPGVADLKLAVNHAPRLLVVAPHPDDEAIGAGGLMQRVAANGGAVRVVLLTSGDGFPEGVEVAGGVARPKPADFRGYGVLREGETRAALHELGVASSQVTFLGLPDDGLCRIASTYLFDKRRAFESPYTNRESPPFTEQLVRGARYRGVDVRREIEQIVETFGPTLIALPHPEDDHPDHCSTHIFVREALLAVAPAARTRVHVLHYLVHYDQWPLTPGGSIGTTLNPPDGFPSSEGRWLSLALTPPEAAAKRRALLAYTSQMRVIGRLLLAFGRTNELFLDGEPASPPECWCDGENVTSGAPPAKFRRGAARP
jgi:LmbE family N-acetylglucosaminyl deacetylase